MPDLMTQVLQWLQARPDRRFQFGYEHRMGGTWRMVLTEMVGPHMLTIERFVCARYTQADLFNSLQIEWEYAKELLEASVKEIQCTHSSPSCSDS